MTIRHAAAALVFAATSAFMPMLAQAGVIEPALLAAAQARPQVDFVLVLGDKADLAAATANASTKNEKGAATVAALKAAAARSQGPVLAALQSRGVPHRAFWVANAITAKGNLADVQALAALAEVRAAYLISTEVNMLSPYIARRTAALQAASGKSAQSDFVAKALGDTAEPGVRQLRAPEVWKLGFTGQGVVVGDHDVGVMWDHPALKNAYRGWNAATSTATHAYNWRNAFQESDVFCTDLEEPCDSNGHGTHTTGTIVGFDGGANQIGVAPGAKWMACRSLLDPILGVGTVPAYMDCMEWQIAPYPQGEPAAADPAMAPDVVSNSWGCIEGCAPPLLEDINIAIKEAGIVQVVSAGNDGDTCSTIIFPLSVYESSFSVGANDVAGAMADFSSRGPVLSNGSMLLKPNVTAPGVDTRSSLNDGDYGELSGTSMAGPHVVGLVALLMSAEPRLKGRVDEVRELVQLSAVQDITTVQTCGGTAVSAIPNNISGWGRVDALNAVNMRPQLAVGIKTPATAKTGEVYEATITARQPDTGKIDVTAATLQLTLPAGNTLVAFSKQPKTVLAIDLSNGAATGYVFEVGTLAPGASWQLKATLKRDTAGTMALDATAEADQVSPVTAATGKTVVSAVATPVVTPPVLPPAPAPTIEAGRFGGGAFGLLGLMLLGLAAAARRQKP